MIGTLARARSLWKSDSDAETVVAVVLALSVVLPLALRTYRMRSEGNI